MSFKNFFKRLLNRQGHPTHLPYIPTPPSQQPNASHQNQFSNNPGTSYTETEINIHTISGTNIGFGTQKIVQVDDRGQAKDLTQSQSHILGTGRIVNKIDDVSGVCPFCQAEALKFFEANLITIEEVQIKSLYDIKSASHCDICGTNTCSRHSRPIVMSNGLAQYFCVNCQKQLKKQLLRQKIKSLLLSPFMEDQNPNDIK